METGWGRRRTVMRLGGCREGGLDSYSLLQNSSAGAVAGAPHTDPPSPPSKYNKTGKASGGRASSREQA